MEKAVNKFRGDSCRIGGITRSVYDTEREVILKGCWQGGCDTKKCVPEICCTFQEKMNTVLEKF